MDQYNKPIEKDQNQEQSQNDDQNEEQVAQDETDSDQVFIQG